MYAIVSDRGRQYKVREGDRLRVDRLQAEKGATVTFDQVLLVDRDGTLQVGCPLVAGARVTGVLEDHARGAKLIALRRTTSNAHVVRRGHRSDYSLVRVQRIEA